MGQRNPSVVTSSTRGVSGQRESSSRRMRAVVDLPTATDPAMPITNGVRSGLLAEELGRDPVQRPDLADVEVQQPGQRQVDLLDLEQADLLAEALQPGQVVLGQGQGRVLAQAGPGGAVELDVRRGQARRAAVSHGRDSVPRALPRARTGSADGPDSLGAMCGIVGYAGPTDDDVALEVVLEGLRRLEYRGYDSAGVALVTADGLATEKRAGKLVNLTDALEDDGLPPSRTAIGHTRWATHGGPTDANAHPHRGGKDGRLALIHNGIIENYATLKAELLADGVEFESETDTEVAAHLVAKAYVEEGDLAEAMRVVCRRLDGAFTLLAVHADAPGVVVGARRNSPLVVGVGEGENFLGSDVAAFISRTRDAVELGQDQVVEITPDDDHDHRLRRKPR